MSVAYATPPANEAFAMTTIIVCSFMLNGWGLKLKLIEPIRKTFFGMIYWHQYDPRHEMEYNWLTRSHPWPSGYATNWTTNVVMEIEGLRRENNILIAHATVVRIIPRVHALIVLQGKSLRVLASIDRCFRSSLLVIVTNSRGDLRVWWVLLKQRLFDIDLFLQIFAVQGVVDSIELLNW